MAASDNYIALLNEHTQRKGWTCRFELVDTEGPDHSKTFTVRAVVNNKPYPDGVGRNKKEARQHAAKNALGLIQEEGPASSVPEEKRKEVQQPSMSDLSNSLTGLNLSSTHSESTGLDNNFIGILNHYCQKTSQACDFKLVAKTGPAHTPEFVYKVIINKNEYPEGRGRSAKQAQQRAAKLAWNTIRQSNGNSQVPEEKRNEVQQPSMSDLSNSLTGLNLSSTHSESTGLDNNFIGILNHYCQKTSQACDFKLVAKTGPAHTPEFVYKVTINKNEYPEGRGRSAKLAQQRAAKLAWNTIRQSNGNSQMSSTSCDSKDETSSFASTQESEGDTSSQGPPISQNFSDSIIFKDSSSHPLSPEKPAVKNLPTPSAETPVSNSNVKSSFFLETYHFINKLGSGGFGRVLKARHKLDQKDYAVKIVKCTSKACREVGALAELLHVNIVRYHTCWMEETAYQDESSDCSSISNSSSEGTFLYILMELCEGDTLNAWIKNKNTINPYPERKHEAAEIMTQVLEAVKYIHSKKLIHRDLKPANIMFGKEDVVKVGDFGLVTEAEANSDEAQLERTNRTGTLSYMSPEQKSKTSYDKKVDIFPLGLIYFELLWTLKTGTERVMIWNDVRNKKLPEGFSRKFVSENKLIEQMLNASPKERPHASDLLTKLEAFRKTVLLTNRNAEKENRTY